MVKADGDKKCSVIDGGGQWPLVGPSWLLKATFVCRVKSVNSYYVCSVGERNRKFRWEFYYSVNYFLKTVSLAGLQHWYCIQVWERRPSLVCRIQDIDYIRPIAEIILVFCTCRERVAICEKQKANYRKMQLWTISIRKMRVMCFSKRRCVSWTNYNLGINMHVYDIHWYSELNGWGWLLRCITSDKPVQWDQSDTLSRQPSHPINNKNRVKGQLEQSKRIWGRKAIGTLLACIDPFNGLRQSKRRATIRESIWCRHRSVVGATSGSCLIQCFFACPKHIWEEHQLIDS